MSSMLLNTSIMMLLAGIGLAANCQDNVRCFRLCRDVQIVEQGTQPEMKLVRQTTLRESIQHHTSPMKDYILVLGDAKRFWHMVKKEAQKLWSFVNDPDARFHQSIEEMFTESGILRYKDGKVPLRSKDEPKKLILNRTGSYFQLRSVRRQFRLLQDTIRTLYNLIQAEECILLQSQPGLESSSEDELDIDLKHFGDQFDEAVIEMSKSNSLSNLACSIAERKMALTAILRRPIPNPSPDSSHQPEESMAEHQSRLKEILQNEWKAIVYFFSDFCFRDDGAEKINLDEQIDKFFEVNFLYSLSSRFK